MLSRTRSRVVCHFSGAWFSSASSLSISCSKKRRKTTKCEKKSKVAQMSFLVPCSYSEKFGDGVRLGVAHAAVTRPNDTPLTVGGGVRLLRALPPHGHHPPVVAGPRGQRLLQEEVPFGQAGDADTGLQDHLRHRKHEFSLCGVLRGLL